MSATVDPAETKLETKFWELTNPANPAKHNEEKAIDVVAVHGLNGQPDAAHWKSEDGSMWLRDLLPKDIRHVRVFELAYDPKELLVGSNDVAESLALFLLARLWVAREDDPKPRPLVFLAHGFGGFVVEKTINYLTECQTDLAELTPCIKKIIFISTPQRAPDEIEWNSLLGNCMADCMDWRAPFFSRSVDETLELLRENKEFLQEVTTEFKKNVARLKIKIFSCYEGVPTPPLEKCSVNGTNAALGLKLEKLRAMPGCNHISIARYSSREDENYQAIMSAIKKVLRSASAEKPATKASKGLSQVNISMNIQPSKPPKAEKPVKSFSELPENKPVAPPIALKPPNLQPQRKHSAPVDARDESDTARSTPKSVPQPAELPQPTPSAASGPQLLDRTKSITRRPLHTSFPVEAPTRQLSASEIAGKGTIPIAEVSASLPDRSKPHLKEPKRPHEQSDSVSPAKRQELDLGGLKGPGYEPPKQSVGITTQALSGNQESSSTGKQPQVPAASPTTIRHELDATVPPKPGDAAGPSPPAQGLTPKTIPGAVSNVHIYTATTTGIPASLGPEVPQQAYTESRELPTQLKPPPVTQPKQPPQSYTAAGQNIQQPQQLKGPAVQNIPSRTPHVTHGTAAAQLAGAAVPKAPLQANSMPVPLTARPPLKFPGGQKPTLSGPPAPHGSSHSTPSITKQTHSGTREGPIQSLPTAQKAPLHPSEAAPRGSQAHTSGSFNTFIQNVAVHTTSQSIHTHVDPRTSGGNTGHDHVPYKPAPIPQRKPSTLRPSPPHLAKGAPATGGSHGYTAFKPFTQPQATLQTLSKGPISFRPGLIQHSHSTSDVLTMSSSKVQESSPHASAPTHPGHRHSIAALPSILSSGPAAGKGIPSSAYNQPQQPLFTTAQGKTPPSLFPGPLRGSAQPAPFAANTAKSIPRHSGFPQASGTNIPPQPSRPPPGPTHPSSRPSSMPGPPGGLFGGKPPAPATSGHPPSRPPMISAASHPSSGPTHHPGGNPPTRPFTLSDSPSVRPGVQRTAASHPPLRPPLPASSSHPPSGTPGRATGSVPYRPFPMSGPSAAVPPSRPPGLVAGFASGTAAPGPGPYAPHRPFSISGPPSNLPGGGGRPPPPALTPGRTGPRPPTLNIGPPKSAVPPNRHSVSGPPPHSLPKGLQPGPAPLSKPGFLGSLFGAKQPAPPKPQPPVPVPGRPALGKPPIPPPSSGGRRPGPKPPFPGPSGGMKPPGPPKPPGPKPTSGGGYQPYRGAQGPPGKPPGSRPGGHPPPPAGPPKPGPGVKPPGHHEPHHGPDHGHGHGWFDWLPGGKHHPTGTNVLVDPAHHTPETKPAEMKPTGTRPEEAKPPGPATEEGKPTVETRPEESKPTDTKPEEPKPPGTETEENKPPAETKPEDGGKPTGTESGTGTQATETKPEGGNKPDEPGSNTAGAEQKPQVGNNVPGTEIHPPEQAGQPTVGESITPGNYKPFDPCIPSTSPAPGVDPTSVNTRPGGSGPQDINQLPAPGTSVQDSTAPAEGERSLHTDSGPHFTFIQSQSQMMYNMYAPYQPLLTEQLPASESETSRSLTDNTSNLGFVQPQTIYNAYPGSGDSSFTADAGQTPPSDTTPHFGFVQPQTVYNAYPSHVDSTSSEGQSQPASGPGHRFEFVQPQTAHDAPSVQQTSGSPNSDDQHLKEPGNAVPPPLQPMHTAVFPDFKDARPQSNSVPEDSPHLGFTQTQTATPAGPDQYFSGYQQAAGQSTPGYGHPDTRDQNTAQPPPVLPTHTAMFPDFAAIRPPTTSERADSPYSGFQRETVPSGQGQAYVALQPPGVHENAGHAQTERESPDKTVPPPVRPMHTALFPDFRDSKPPASSGLGGSPHLGFTAAQSGYAAYTSPGQPSTTDSSVEQNQGPFQPQYGVAPEDGNQHQPGSLDDSTAQPPPVLPTHTAVFPDFNTMRPPTESSRGATEHDSGSLMSVGEQPFETSGPPPVRPLHTAVFPDFRDDRQTGLPGHVTPFGQQDLVSGTQSTSTPGLAPESTRSGATMSESVVVGGETTLPNFLGIYNPTQQATTSPDHNVSKPPPVLPTGTPVFPTFPNRDILRPAGALSIPEQQDKTAPSGTTGIFSGGPRDLGHDAGHDAAEQADIVGDERPRNFLGIYYPGEQGAEQPVKAYAVGTHAGLSHGLGLHNKKLGADPSPADATRADPAVEQQYTPFFQSGFSSSAQPSTQRQQSREIPVASQPAVILSNPGASTTTSPPGEAATYYDSFDKPNPFPTTNPQPTQPPFQDYQPYTSQAQPQQAQPLKASLYAPYTPSKDQKKSSSGTALKVAAGVVAGAAVAGLATAGIMHALHDNDDSNTDPTSGLTDASANAIPRDVSGAALGTQVETASVSDVDDSDAYASTVDSSDLESIEADSDDGRERSVNLEGQKIDTPSVSVVGATPVMNPFGDTEDSDHHDDYSDQSVANSSDLDTDVESIANHEHQQESAHAVDIEEDSHDPFNELQAALATAQLAYSPADEHGHDSDYENDSIADSSVLDTDDAHTDAGDSEPEALSRDLNFDAQAYEEYVDHSNADNQYFNEPYFPHADEEHTVDPTNMSDPSASASDEHDDDHDVPDSDDHSVSGFNYSGHPDTDDEHGEPERDIEDHGYLDLGQEHEAADFDNNQYDSDYEQHLHRAMEDIPDHDDSDDDIEHGVEDSDNEHNSDEDEDHGETGYHTGYPYQAQDSDQEHDDDDAGDEPQSQPGYWHVDDDDDGGEDPNSEVASPEVQHPAGYWEGDDDDEEDDTNANQYPQGYWQGDDSQEDDDGDSDDDNAEHSDGQDSEDDENEENTSQYPQGYWHADDDDGDGGVNDSDNDNEDSDVDEDEDEDAEEEEDNARQYPAGYREGNDEDEGNSDDDDEDKDEDENNYQAASQYQNQYQQDSDDEDDDDEDEDEPTNAYQSQYYDQSQYQNYGGGGDDSDEDDSDDDEEENQGQYQQYQPDYSQDYQQEYHEPEPVYQEQYQEPEPMYQEEYQQEYYQPEPEYQQEYQAEPVYQQEYYESEPVYQQEPAYYEEQPDYDYSGGYEQAEYDNGGDYYEGYDGDDYGGGDYYE